MRKLSNLLIGLCAVLFITSFIMGAGLLQSDSRIAALENAVITMDSNYVVIVEQFRQFASLPAFAEQPLQPVADITDNEAQTPPQQSQPPTPPPTPAPEPPQDTTEPPQDVQEPPNGTQPPEEYEPVYLGEPPPPDVPVFANVPETYTIQPGDSLLAISRMFYGDTAMAGRIMEINGIVDPNHIVVGQIIYLPNY